jgi:hypothetical protein
MGDLIDCEKNLQNEEPVKKTIDYNEEYKNYLRCRSCNRKSKGIEDYKSVRTNRTVKTCIKCRMSVINSNKKNVRPKKPTKKECVEGLRELIYRFDKDTLNKILDENDKYKIFL